MDGDAVRITPLLQLWAAGDPRALDRLLPLVYEQLRQLAHNRMRNERDNHTLNTTGLVHEAYLRLVHVERTTFRDRSHFLAMASRLMRRVLVDYARARQAAKRGGQADRASLGEAAQLLPEEAAEAVLELDEAIERLEVVAARPAQVVEQHYFSGLTIEETAEALGVSASTVKGDLRFARAWLAANLSGGAAA